MKKLLSSLLFLLAYWQESAAQNNEVRASAIGISFFLDDFVTPQNIRSTSLKDVITKRKWAHIGEMGSGLALHYFNGLSPHVDFSCSVSGSFTSHVLPSQESDDNFFLLESDAGIQYKFLTEKHLVTPYLTAGIGASEIHSYYGAIIPVGAGVKLNLYDEAAIFLSSQYRIPVTIQTNNFHFIYSLGIAGVIGERKSKPARTQYLN